MSDLPFPPLEDLEDSADKIVEYQKAACSKEDPAKLQRFLEYEQARFTVASKPWMAVPADSKPDSPFFEPVKTEDPKIKLANRNECAPIIDGETARLIGSTSEPEVTPTKATTVVHRAAKKAEMVLDDILFRNRWTPLLGQDAKNVTQFGTGYLFAGFENDYGDLHQQPAKVHACDAQVPTGEPPAMVMDPETGVEMPGEAPTKRCGWKMLAAGGEAQAGGGIRYTGDMAKEMVEAGVGSSVSNPEDEFFATTLHECPECGGALEERRAMPGEGDDLDGALDSFGYELTEKSPLAKVFVRAYYDPDVFFIGDGRAPHGFMPEYTIETIESIDWLVERYEHADKIDPMSLGEMEELARWHPAGMEMWGFSGRGLANDQKRWAPVRITVRQPFKFPKDRTKDEPMGRLMISANKTVLYNGPLMLKYKTEEGIEKMVPRVQLFPFANEEQNQSVRGVSVFSRLVGPQQALDAMLTQFVWDMAENGSPTLLMPFGANMEGQGDGWEVEESTPEIPNRVIRFNAEAGEPIVAGGKVTHQDWQVFTEGLVEHMQRTTGQSQLDRGEAVKGAPSATAQITIGQRLDETRKPKGQRWADRLSNLFSYMLECVVAVYTEPRQFSAVDALDNRTVRDFKGADLMGQTTVKVATKPAHDTEAFQRANILELLPLGLIDISTPRQKIRIMKKLGASDELDPEPNQQIQAAQDEFLDFTLPEDRIKPIAKKRTDNHPFHRGTHLEDLRSPAGEALRKWWPLHELATTGWYEEFEQLMLAEMRLKSPAAAPEPVVLLDPATDGPDTPLIAAQSEARRADALLEAKIQGMPKNIQLRIEAIQMGLLEQFPDFQTLDEQSQDDARALTEFLAHCDAHEWYERELMMAMAPPPVTGPDNSGQEVQPVPPSPPA